ncbi:MAG TPA: DUF3300 domain-containing protein, partial [Planctomycetota bacterium]|nr:DUF3300 domain-containing protein [Planctomycetota bacterium]
MTSSLPFRCAKVAAALLATASLAPAQTETQPAAAGGFSETQLEQLVAPIALYPDALMMQILMASTYPLEIVQADRWLKKNASLKGKALEDALKEQDWDPTVKSLCTVPEVLTKLSENLEWTQDLGDAFLGQEAKLLDVVQKMRSKAHEAGNLETTKEQKVTVQEDKIIVIESSDPEVIYVPSYSPTVVYGPAWTYPAPYYPPLYAPVPPGYGFMAFGMGMMAGAAMWGGCSWGWGHSEVDIDVDHNYKFNEKTSKNAEKLQSKRESGGKSKGDWKHNPEHRKGANYRDKGTAQKYGGGQGSNRVSRDQARGFDRGGSAQQRPAGGGPRTPGGASQQPAAGARPSGGANRPAQSGNRPAARP